MMGGVIDRPGRHFGLKNWRHWLGLARQSTLHPAELRSIQRRHLHHSGVYVAVVVHQFRAKRRKKSEYRVLRGTICRLQGNAAIRQCRSHMDDATSVAGQTML